MSTADYCAYYESQMGGAQLRVFRGGIQSGAGLGDILRGVFRFLVPIALRGLGSFAGRTLLGAQAGKSLGEAAKAALAPSLGLMAQHAVPAASQFLRPYFPGATTQQQQQQQQQSQQQREDTSTEKQRGGGSLFDGIEGIPTSSKAISEYKRSAASGREAKRKPAKSVRVNF
jgi:hypothetical protein